MSRNVSAPTPAVKGAPRSGAGLVPYSTSQTQAKACAKTDPLLSDDVLVVSSGMARYARMKHHLRTASRLVRETMQRRGRRWRAVFITLTYRNTRDWRPKHIASFLDTVRKWSGRAGEKVSYVWVAELQKRGTVHYHIVLWLPSRLMLPRPDKKGWWRHGSTNVQTVKRNAVGYLMNYVSKGAVLDDTGHMFPRGARICGSGGLDRLAGLEFHYWRLPRYVRNMLDAESLAAGPCHPDMPGVGRKATRAPGGGWMSRQTGEVVQADMMLWAICHRKHKLTDRNVDTYTVLHKRFGRQPAQVVFDPAIRDAWQSWVKEAAYDLVASRFDWHSTQEAVGI